MWRWLSVMAILALPAMAAETGDRSKPIFNWAASSSHTLQTAHLPDALVSGERLLRIVYLSGWVDEPWEETYLITTNEDGRPASIRFEIKHTGSEKLGRDTDVSGMRDLTDAELTDLRAAFAKVKICSTPAQGQEVMDAPVVFFEFADEERYCFADRSPDLNLEFDRLYELTVELSGVKTPHN